MREDILTTRREKLNKAREVFGEAYPEKILGDESRKNGEPKARYIISEALRRFDELSGTDERVAIAGRIRSFRLMGKICFAHLEDESGKMQGFFSKEFLVSVGGSRDTMAFEHLKSIVDIGDFIEIMGTVFLTKQNEKSIRVESWRMLAKSLRPLPTEFYGLKDEEELLRRRYLDLALNGETRELFRKKRAFWRTVREFLDNERFLEVQTPVLEHIPGGAEAEPFITHHNALDQDFYLRISLELPLKRLLVGGYERVFEIGRVFRNEGIDREHLQEFDHMEFYAAYVDMEGGMELVERLYRSVVREVVGEERTEWEGHTIDWSKPFPRIDYFDMFKAETGLDLSTDISVESLKSKADQLGIVYEPSYGKGRMIDTIYKKTVRKKLIQPCFLVGHPIEVSPLAKRDPRNDRRVLRFQPIACASELGNGFSELNDPIDQRARFEEQMKLREAGDVEAQQIDEDFLEALEYGMPPACGFGMSERFFAILMNRPIRETVIFPPMRSIPRKSTGEGETKIAVALLNESSNLEPWQQLNTMTHLGAAFGARSTDNLFFCEGMHTRDGVDISLNIRHAIIVKKARSNDDIRALVRRAKSSGVHVAEFTREMLETTDDKKIIDVVASKQFSDVEYLGVLVFGKRSQVEALTNQFLLA